LGEKKTSGLRFSTLPAAAAPATAAAAPAETAAAAPAVTAAAASADDHFHGADRNHDLHTIAGSAAAAILLRLLDSNQIDPPVLSTLWHILFTERSNI
jgi:hypothetical protein